MTAVSFKRVMTRSSNKNFCQLDAKLFTFFFNSLYFLRYRAPKITIFALSQLLSSQDCTFDKFLILQIGLTNELILIFSTT